MPDSAARSLPTFVEASDGDRVELARELFREYADELPVALDFQGFEAELATLPGRYARPRGRLLVAYLDGEPAGCVALRQLQPTADGRTVCEMKRMHVRPAFRRRGLGRQLGRRIIAEAQAIGYDLMRLDTLASMRPATALYESLGFHYVDAYYPNPIPDARYLELDLR